MPPSCVWAPAVAMALKDRFPNKTIIIAGNDDHQQEARSCINSGRSKMEEAARAVNGTGIAPTFAPGERVNTTNGFSDFNNLATKSVLGREGVEQQVRVVIDGAIARHAASSDPSFNLADHAGREQSRLRSSTHTELSAPALYVPGLNPAISRASR